MNVISKLKLLVHTHTKPLTIILSCVIFGLCLAIVVFGNINGGAPFGYWSAQWIWNGERSPNNFILARKIFILHELPKTAILKITAQDRYVAYIIENRINNCQRDDM